MQRRKPLVRRTPIRPRTKRIVKTASKRKSQLEQYYPLRELFLANHQECEICNQINTFRYYGANTPDPDIKKIWMEIAWWPVCHRKSVEVHHTIGREGMLLLATEHWLASCSSKTRRNGHTWIKEFPAAAMFLGIIKRRNT